MFDDPETKIETDSIDQAMVEYQMNCGVCYGTRMAAAGGAPDLRTSSLAAYLPSLTALLRDGLLESRGMPRFSHLTEEQIKQIHAAIRQTVRTQLETQSSPNLEER